MSVFEQFPQIQPLTTHAGQVAVAVAAAADGHGCPHASHVVLKRGEIIGAVALFRAPVVFWWMDSQKAGPRDSAQTWNLIENLARQGNVREIIVPCSESSPYFGMLEACGFEKGQTMTLFTKPVSYRDPAAPPEPVNFHRNGESSHVL